MSKITKTSYCESAIYGQDFLNIYSYGSITNFVMSICRCKYSTRILNIFHVPVPVPNPLFWRIFLFSPFFLYLPLFIVFSPFSLFFLNFHSFLSFSKIFPLFSLFPKFSIPVPIPLIEIDGFFQVNVPYSVE